MKESRLRASGPESKSKEEEGGKGVGIRRGGRSDSVGNKQPLDNREDQKGRGENSPWWAGLKACHGKTLMPG